MPVSPYEDVLTRIQRLSQDEQLRLLAELALLVRRPAPSPKPHSILELRGLGKEMWASVDVQRYLDEERDSWDG